MARPCSAAATYQRRQPEQTVLYRAIATHLPTFLARTAAEDGTGGWPAFVRREFEAYLRYAGSDPFAAQAPLFAQTVSASLQGRVALGPRAGQALRRLRSAASAQTIAPRCARLEGFSLHADVAVPARRRDQLERVCRYLLRPPLALERLTESSGGQLLYQFRRPWRDGSTALLLDPLELLGRLVALVPPPRRPLVAYHGLLAPHAGWRAALVPAAPSDAQPAGSEGPRSPGRLPWATLLRRVFAIEVLVCPRCAGPRRILDTMTEPEAVRRLLGALGLAAQPPPGRPVTAS